MPRYALLLFLFTLCLPAPVLARAPVIQPVIVAEYPHDTATSTQGFFFHDGLFYESSGGFGKSFLAIVQSDTGQHITVHPIDDKYFAEGIAPMGDALYLLTWLSGTGFVHDLTTLKQQRHFSYRKAGETAEGWGLTTNGTRLIRSNGTAQLTFHRPEDFARITAIQVKDGDKPVRMLNELEYVDGRILANIWKSDEIVVIDEKSGNVTARIALAPLRERIGPECGTANGIAYDKETGRLFVTGKLWDKVFEIRVDEVFGAEDGK